MVLMSIMGSLMGWPPIWLSVVSRGLPFSINEMSELVPPMSMVMMLWCSVAWDRSTPVSTPPAGPERTVLALISRAMPAVMTPPLDCMM